MQFRFYICVLLCCLSIVIEASVAEEVTSTTGERPESFVVKDCTGPAAGKNVCYYCRFAERPVVCLFIRELNDEASELIVSLENLVVEQRDERLASFVVLISEDTDAAEKQLKQLAEKENIQHVPLTIYRDSDETLSNAFGFGSDSHAKLTFWLDREMKAISKLPQSDFDNGKIDSFVEKVRQQVSDK